MIFDIIIELNLFSIIWNPSGLTKEDDRVGYILSNSNSLLSNTFVNISYIRILRDLYYFNIYSYNCILLSRLIDSIDR
jgi:hypothetical protein